MTKRYRIKVTMDEYRGHRGVGMRLFHADELPEEIYEQMMAEGLDCDDPYLRSAVEETFSEDEVAALRDWFAGEWPNGSATFRCEPAAREVSENRIGSGAIPVGGSSDFYLFSEHEGWPLPCAVWGYYDLEHAESGPYVNRPELSLTRLSVTGNGVVVKQPPF